MFIIKHVVIIVDRKWIQSFIYKSRRLDLPNTCHWNWYEYIESPVVDEGRMTSGHWLVLVLCVSFSALTLLVG